MNRYFLFLIIVIFSYPTFAKQLESKKEQSLNLNKPERIEWFRNLGFGMFIHFSFDSQLGIVISHSMVGASDNYLERFINELPQTFYPKDFDAKEIATLAKLAGMKYLVLTCKHHSGFCMWDTETTDFNIMQTPYGKDLVAEYVKATKEAGLAVGFYFSPEDFNFLYENNLPIRRTYTEPLPESIMNKYLELNELQNMELMAKYGDIDIMFFDGGEGPLVEKCKQVVWELQPNLVVTRGAMNTPEQSLPGVASTDPWEANLTIGTQWAFKPNNEAYKSATRLLEILIETRAKGGNQLLNVGPKPNGELPEEQQNRLQEIAAWNFINGEALQNIEPWILPNEENIWYTWKPDENILYAILTRIPDWPHGERREFILKSVKATTQTKIEVLGQSGKLVEYQPQIDAKTYFEQLEDGLHISCVRAQRIYNNRKWPNPVVLKITNPQPAIQPPTVFTNEAEVLSAGGMVKLVLKGNVTQNEKQEKLKVGFQYREYAGFVEELYSDEWKETRAIELTEGEFEITLPLRKEEKTYQFRIFADQKGIRIFGDIKRITF